MTYTYKIPRVAKPRFGMDRLKRPAENENLTGYVNGYEASDIEERFARALHRLRLGFEFLVQVPRLGYLPSQENQIDFVVYGSGSPRPIEIDGEFSHKTSGQQGKDALRDALLSPIFSAFGWQPLVRIPFTRLLDQTSANRVAREVLL